MVIRVYLSRTPGNPAIKQEQEFIKRILSCKNIAYEEVDIADPLHAKDKELMYLTLKSLGPRDNPGGTMAIERDLVNGDLPPQLFNEDRYRGDFHGFFDAVESETLFQYLDLEIPSHELEYQRRMKQNDAT